MRGIKSDFVGCEACVGGAVPPVTSRGCCLAELVKARLLMLQECESVCVLIQGPNVPTLGGKT